MSSDSDSDSESDTDDTKTANIDKTLGDGENSDEDTGPAPTTGSYFQTKNEVAEGDVRIPDIQSVDPEEYLEKVGEIMSVVENVVIVKGLPSDIANRGAARALDSDTLLVFEDRTVMGYVGTS
jgi:H/ACA ribonucleoprotein complex non-core subunit NAF1